MGLFKLRELGVDRGERFLDGLEILLEFLDATSSACRRTAVVTWILGTMCLWVPFLMALVTFLFLPVVFVIGTGIMAFSIAIAASVTATSTALLCE
jgi:hypothetical protein